jgi:microsomal dipeptidase-like Zn-dependent dipeptidase
VSASLSERAEGIATLALTSMIIRACNRLGIMVDMSHINERGFWDIASTSMAPLVATP